MIRPISAARKRKLQKRGVRCWWDVARRSYVWDMHQTHFANYSFKD